MIIEALYEHYKTLSRRPGSDVPPPGFASEPVAWVFNLSADGELLDTVPLSTMKGDRVQPQLLIVPELLGDRTSTKLVPRLLCDNSMYIVGDDHKNDPKRSQQAFAASRDLHLEVLRDVDDEGARAVCRYFLKWDPGQARVHPALRHVLDEVLAGRNIVFRLDGVEGYVHQQSEVRDAWLAYRKQITSTVRAQCLVTGEYAPIARTHPKIKGVPNSRTPWVALSSYNLESSLSYGKRQNFNAPISELVAFRYTTVLNHLLSNPRQRLQLDATTTLVFWSERQNGEREENLLAQLLGSQNEGVPIEKESMTDGPTHDSETARIVRDVLTKVRRGEPLDFDAIQVDPESRFYLLGLSPNRSRLSVRLWHVDTFGRLVHRVAQHHADMAIVAPKRHQDNYISIREILRQTVPKRDQNRDWSKRVPPLLAGGLMRAILSGQPYPHSLYSAIIGRIRADAKERVNYVRAALIKAFFLRRSRFGWQLVHDDDHFSDREVTITVSLDANNKTPAYLLGRLFAVLEKAQTDANPGLNATIRDRYFGAASATPRAVFPQLLRLAQHHIAKAKYGHVSDRLIESILADLSEFPTHLDLGQQGLFMLGYYHQRQAFYEKSASKE